MQTNPAVEGKLLIAHGIIKSPVSEERSMEERICQRAILEVRMKD